MGRRMSRGAGEQENFAIPLVIGVTGHRDLPPEDFDRLEQSVSDIFRKLKKEHPHTPLSLLTL